MGVGVFDDFCFHDDNDHEMSIVDLNTPTPHLAGLLPPSSVSQWFYLITSA